MIYKRFRYYFISLFYFIVLYTNILKLYCQYTIVVQMNKIYAFISIQANKKLTGRDET